MDGSFEACSSPGQPTFHMSPQAWGVQCHSPGSLSTEVVSGGQRTLRTGSQVWRMKKVTAEELGIRMMQTWVYRL